MFKLLLSPLILLLVLGCSQTRMSVKPPTILPDSTAEKAKSDSLKWAKLAYVDSDCGFRFSLPKMDGWELGKPGETLPANVVFGGIHFGRLTTVVLAIEKINSTPEDYFVIARSANQIDKRPGFKEIQKDTLNINGFHTLRLVYQSDIALPDTLAQDSLSGKKTYIFTNYFIQAGGCAAWLEIGTLAETYASKVSFISEIGSGFCRQP